MRIPPPPPHKNQTRLTLSLFHTLPRSIFMYLEVNHFLNTVFVCLYFDLYNSD